MRTRRLTKNLYRKIFGRKRRRLSESSELSTSGIHQSGLRAIAAAAAMPSSGDYLDVGSGTGELLWLVQAHYPFRSFGCDYTDKLVSVPGPRIDTIDLNRQSLPYSDQTFRARYMRRNHRALGKPSGGHPGNLSCSATWGYRSVFDPKRFESAISSALSVLRFLQFVWAFSS